MKEPWNGTTHARHDSSLCDGKGVMKNVKWDAWDDAGGHDDAGVHDAGVHDEAGFGVNQSPSFKDLQYFERLCRT